MNGTALLALVDDGGADVHGLDPAAVIEILSSTAQAGPNQAWALFADPVDYAEARRLTVGLSEDGQHGWLSWWDGYRRWEPISVQPTGRWVDYWNADQHLQVDEGQHMAAATIVAVVREYLQTLDRPASLEWRPTA
ncbi:MULTISPECIES: hypothetical protein [unclassified Crossiella]|uniref:hypothetical protein n=1 Tax=unclassified Crossiella TaxID=2620835 RepID=UPI001FFEA952|nr:MULTISPECIES: hypothetical protein [unclassified Crossiella]MCK2240895.1 hypothetical protein [Crossiella sp. S99.2]MCK2253961.1 hypothetical protein [Crossiella sp. S99.1]